MTKKEEFIKNFEAQIQLSHETGDPPNETSWGSQTGILISRNDAFRILGILRQTSSDHIQRGDNQFVKLDVEGKILSTEKSYITPGGEHVPGSKGWIIPMYHPCRLDYFVAAALTGLAADCTIESIDSVAKGAVEISKRVIELLKQEEDEKV